jgi:hypothetical protein
MVIISASFDLHVQYMSIMKNDVGLMQNFGEHNLEIKQVFFICFTPLSSELQYDTLAVTRNAGVGHCVLVQYNRNYIRPTASRKNIQIKTSSSYHNFRHYQLSCLLFKTTTFRRLYSVSVFRRILLKWAQQRELVSCFLSPDTSNNTNRSYRSTDL